MKTNYLLLLCAFTILLSSATAQEYNYQITYNHDYYQAGQDVGHDNKNVKQKTVYNTNKKAQTSKYIYKYNKDGQLTSFESINRKGKIVSQQINEYNDWSAIAMMERYKRGKLDQQVITEYNADHNVVAITTINGKGKTVRKKTYVYKDKKLTESYLYKRGGKKISKQWLYNYNNEGKKTRSTLLNSRGKIMHEWTYECNDEGIKLAQTKDETQVCKYQKTEDDYLIQVNQSFDDEGKISKYVRKYTLKDTLIVESSRYDKKDRIKYLMTYDHSYYKQTSYKSFTKKGKLRSQSISKYDGDNIIEKRYTYKGKLRSETNYKYQDNRIVEREYLYKSKLSHKAKYEYEFYDVI